MTAPHITTNGSTRSGTISRTDIENKLHELRGEVDQAIETGRSIGVVLGVAIGVTAVVLSYWMGRRRGRKRQMILEIKRI